MSCFQISEKYVGLAARGGDGNIYVLKTEIQFNFFLELMNFRQRKNEGRLRKQFVENGIRRTGPQGDTAAVQAGLSFPDSQRRILSTA